MFYERSQGLVGICRDVGSGSSRTLTLDLTKYDEPAESAHGVDTEKENRPKKKRRAVSEGGVSSKKPALGAVGSPSTIATTS
jgi:hypothetical protein